jgi:hypothetical protein
MTQRTPTLLKEVAAGNVLIIGDAISNESWIQGAIACGYQGAKATLKELNGQKGYLCRVYSLAGEGLRLLGIP